MKPPFFEKLQTLFLICLLIILLIGILLIEATAAAERKAAERAHRMGYAPFGRFENIKRSEAFILASVAFSRHTGVR